MRTNNCSKLEVKTLEQHTHGRCSDLLNAESGQVLPTELDHNFEKAFACSVKGSSPNFVSNIKRINSLLSP